MFIQDTSRIFLLSLIIHRRPLYSQKWSVLRKQLAAYSLSYIELLKLQLELSVRIADGRLLKLHVWWSFFTTIIKNFNPLAILAQKLHHRCLNGS